MNIPLQIRRCSGMRRILLLLTIPCCFVVRVRSHSFHSYPYLYFDENNTNASFPIIDHIAPKGEVKLENDQPDFLYKAPPNEYRVVEFYVHWCDICRHFSKHYVKYARRIQQLVANRSPEIEITFHAISCVPNRPLCRKQSVTGHPLIKLFKPKDMEGTWMRHTQANPIAILQELGVNMTGMDISDKLGGWDEPEVDNDSDGVESWWSTWYNYVHGLDGTATGNNNNKAMYRRTRQDLKNDIHLSFDFAMRNNVYVVDGDDKLSPEAKEALLDYFVLLQRTIPPSWVEFHALLADLIRNFRYVSKKEPYLIKFLDKHLPKSLAEGSDPEWSVSCSRGEPGRGFTCGLWETFHAITVGVFTYNLNQVEDPALITTDSVANTIRDFVRYFFTCNECREHFLNMYDSCAFQRCTRLKKVTKLTGDQVAEKEWQELSLWLYEVHNSVNVRLVDEKAAREHRKTSPQDAFIAQWPSLRDCHPCWLPPDRNGIRKWNETVVFNYLRLEYGPRDAAATEFQRQLLEANLAAVEHDAKLLRLGGPSIATSAFLPPLIIVAFLAMYMIVGARGNVCLRRVVTRKKVRTV